MNTPHAHKRLGDLLIEKKKITAEQLDEALSFQKKTGERLGHALIRLSYLTEDELLVFLTEQFGVPAMRIDRKMLNPAVSRLLPFDLCMRYRVIPIMKSENILVVAATDPFNMNFVNEIRKAYPFAVEMVLAPENAVMDAIEIVFGRLDRSLEARHAGAESDAGGAPMVSADEELVRVIRRALQLHAHETQLSWKDGKLTVFYLTQAMVPEQNSLSREMYAELLKVLKIRAKIPLEGVEDFQEGIFSVETPEKQVFFRVHVFPTSGGETVTFKMA